jgi:hypothetical protein
MIAIPAAEAEIPGMSITALVKAVPISGLFSVSRFIDHSTQLPRQIVCSPAKRSLLLTAYHQCHQFQLRAVFQRRGEERGVHRVGRISLAEANLLRIAIHDPSTTHRCPGRRNSAWSSSG